MATEDKTANYGLTQVTGDTKVSAYPAIQAANMKILDDALKKNADAAAGPESKPALTWRGSKPTASDLPSGAAVGDVWHVEADSGEYAWDGSAWQSLGPTVDLSGKQDKLTAAQMAAADSGITASDKAKLDGIEAGANAYSLPPATAGSLGGVKVGANLSVAEDGTLSADAQKQVVDATLDGESANPVANKAVKAALDAKADSAAVPTAVSQLANDSGYLTGEADPTVPAWAKQPKKPSYSAEEVGAYPKASVDAMLAGKQDALEAGANVTISGNAVSAKDTTYTVFSENSDGLAPGVMTNANGQAGTYVLMDNGKWVNPSQLSVGSANSATSVKTLTDSQKAELKGDTGPSGKDGTSCTHSWSGSVLTVTSASGTSSADLRGPKGDQGPQGEAGSNLTISELEKTFALVSADAYYTKAEVDAKVGK